MKMGIFVIVLSSLMLFSCNQEQLDRLTQNNERLTKENAELQDENQKLRSDIKKIEATSGQLLFLSKKLRGVKARLVTTMGDIELAFYTDKAPLHVFNFIARAESGYYDNTQFHRVIPGFMIQGGDPKSKDNDFSDDGTGGPFVNIPHEFNDTKHVPGVLSMARTGDVSAGAGCQFFIMHGTAPHLDGQYTAFGEVTSGMDVVNEIAQARTYGASNPKLADHPVQPIRIKRVEIYRHGDGRQ